MFCNNCDLEVHVPDDRTGLIHINGKYACYFGKVRLSTVAEADIKDTEELPEYSGAI